jgi:gamma-glutamylcyclotransferase
VTDIRYFAYGSNMDPKIMESHSPEARALGPGKVDGYRVEFNVFSERWNGGAANLEPDPNGYVWGVVWELSEEDARNLDTYVGHPTYYAREEVPVGLGDEVVSCLTYRVRAQHGYVRPTDEYLNRLRSAVRVQGLPPEALDIIERAARPPERPHIRT